MGVSSKLLHLDRGHFFQPIEQAVEKFADAIRFFAPQAVHGVRPAELVGIAAGSVIEAASPVKA